MTRQLIALLVVSASVNFAVGEENWRKNVVLSGDAFVGTAVGGDFTGDRLPDVICNSSGKTRLLVAPDWREVILDETPGYGAMHSETFDVDGDSDLDYIAARYTPGLVFWLERPAKPLEERWQLRIAEDKIDGIHGLLKGDIDGNGRFDLIANSAQPKQPFPSSAVWLRAPKDVRGVERWDRHVFAKEDAFGLSHYFGFGDVDGDGRPDISLAAKGGNQAESTSEAYFAWWQAPRDLAQPWTKHVLADRQGGATNIQPADVNGDGKMDFIATRGHQQGVIWFEAPTWKIHDIHPTLREPHSLAVVDMDGDGDVDCATCAFGDSTCAWFENDGKGYFKTHIVGTDQKAYDIRAIDMDNDGDLDLLVAGQNSKNVVWYANPRL